MENKNNTLIFDIGAHIGMWTTQNYNSNTKIICCEASPSTFNSLKQNLKNLNVECLNYAVCNTKESIKFYDCDISTISTINLDWIKDPKSRFYNCTQYKEISIKTITIDELIKTHGIPDLIKIDVEGGEFDCISSLTEKVPNLCFEWASEMNDVTFKCLDHLESLGFKNFYLQFEDNYKFRPDSYNEDINSLKEKLKETKTKDHWGMIWVI